MKIISNIYRNIYITILNEVEKQFRYLLQSFDLKTNNNFRDYLSILFTLCTFFLIFMVIYGIKLRLYSPIFEDDFHILSLEVNNIKSILSSARPVGYLFTTLTNLLSINEIYIFYFFLTIVNLSLIFFIIKVFFRIEKSQFYLYLIVCSLISCSFYEYFISLKHIRAAGIFSSLFFYLNIILLFKICKIKNIYLFTSGLILSSLLLLLSIFSKEDFILPNILIFMIFIFYLYKTKNYNKMYLISSILLTVIFFWLYINFFYYNNYFISDGGGLDANYQKNLSVISIIFSYGVYIFYFKPTAFYSIYLFSLIFFLRKNLIINKSIIFYVFIFLIIFPFSLLSKKFITEYIIQWFPFVTGLISFYLCSLFFNKKLNMNLRLLLFTFLLIIFSSSIIISKSKLTLLNQKLIKSHNYIKNIENNIEVIKKYELVKIDLQGEGDVPNPWYRQTGHWFNKKLNLDNKWYIFTDESTKLYKVKDDFHYDEIKHNSKIKIFSRSQINEYDGLTLKFDPQGNLIELTE